MKWWNRKTGFWLFAILCLASIGLFVYFLMVSDAPLVGFVFLFTALLFGWLALRSKNPNYHWHDW